MKIVNNYEHDTGLRYYENKDVIVFTALKVASRYCDNYFYNDQLDKVKELSFKDGKFYSRYSTIESNHCYTDVTLNNILKGKEKRKIIFLYRDPIERFISTLNHFYTDFLCNIILDYERYPLSDSVFDEGSAYYNDEQLTKGRNAIPQKVKDCITDKFFQELHTSNIHWQLIRHKTRGKDGKIIQVIGTDDTIRLNQMADIFLNYESDRVFDTENESYSKDPHYSSYIKSYNKIINDKNCKNISIFNIDDNNLGKLFGADHNVKNGKINPHTKHFIRNALQKNYKSKSEIEEKFNQEIRELTQLKIWRFKNGRVL